MPGMLTLMLRSAQDGAVLAERHDRNSVTQVGGKLIADLFRGKGTAITHMGVGTSGADDPDFALTALSNDSVAGQPPLTGDVTAALTDESFTVTPDPVRRVVAVRVRGTMPPAAAVGTVREAGLLSKQADGTFALYNRVVFAPFDKGSDHELTLFWEITFPYGDLQALL
jgi:hypothetical protein